MNVITSEIAPFAEYPGAWTIWALNMIAVGFVVFGGGYAAIKKQMRYWLPLVVAFVPTYGWRSLVHTPFPQILRDESIVDAEGRMLPLISHSSSVDLIAWGAAIAILLSLLSKKPNQ